MRQCHLNKTHFNNNNNNNNNSNNNNNNSQPHDICKQKFRMTVLISPENSEN